MPYPLDSVFLCADALQLLASFLFSPDRAALQLLYVLDWRPVLQQLAPVTPNRHPNPSDPLQSSLLDHDMSLSSDAPDAGSACEQQTGEGQQTRARVNEGGLDAGGKAWAAQLLLLIMQAYTVMADGDLPDWIRRLIKGSSDRDLMPGGMLPYLTTREK